MFAIVGGHLPVIGGTPAEAELKELIAFSEKKENWFNKPEQSAEARKTSTDPRPNGGHHAPHTRHITVHDSVEGEETYHVSFTITQGQIAPGGDISKAKDALFRHATIGVGDMERLVDPIEAFTVLKFLGFKSVPVPIRHPDFPALVFLEILTPEEEEALQGRSVCTTTGSTS